MDITHFRLQPCASMNMGIYTSYHAPPDVNVVPLPIFSSDGAVPIHSNSVSHDLRNLSFFVQCLCFVLGRILGFEPDRNNKNQIPSVKRIKNLENSASFSCSINDVGKTVEGWI
jgi:hypothetical protein